MMNEVMYEELVSLLDIYERNKKESDGLGDCVFYEGAIYALKELKRKIESYEAERTK